MAKSKFSFPTEIFDQASFSRKVQDMELDAKALKDYEGQLLRNGIPTNTKWLKSMTKEGAFKTYIDKQCSDFLSGAAFVPTATKNEVKRQYIDAYETNKSAVSRAASIVSREDYIFDEDETGTPSINVEATREDIRKSCYDSVDVEKLEKMAHVIDGILKAVEALDATATELSLPTLASGIPITNPIGGLAYIYTQDFFQAVARGGENNAENLTLWLYGSSVKRRK